MDTREGSDDPDDMGQETHPTRDIFTSDTVATHPEYASFPSISIDPVLIFLPTYESSRAFMGCTTATERSS